MEEKRKHPRIDVNEAGYVSAAGSVMSCIVLNVSVDGAAIEIDNPSFVPQNFRLVVTGSGQVHECRIAWTQQKRIGCSFVAPPQQDGTK